MNFRNQAPLHYSTELNRLIDEIRLKPIDGKESASIELKRVYMKQTEWSEQVYSV